MAGSRVDVVHREATPSAPLTRSGVGRMLRCPVSGGRSGEGVVSPTPARSDLLGSDCLGLRARGASGCRCSSLAQGVLGGHCAREGRGRGPAGGRMPRTPPRFVRGAPQARP